MASPKGNLDWVIHKHTGALIISITRKTGLLPIRQRVTTNTANQVNKQQHGLGKK